MSFRRVMPCVALLLLAASALAQLTSEVKEEVLLGMDEVLRQEAFVPGVDLDNWRTFLDRRSEDLEEAQTPWAFANVVNGALSDFGVSHIRLSASRSRRPWRGRPSAFQNPERQTGFPSQGNTVRWLSDDAAVVRIRSFGFGYDPDEIEAMFEEVADARRLVLDLRSNPGGEVRRLQHMLSLLFPSGTPVGTFVSRRMAQEFVRAGRGSGRDSVAIAMWSPGKFRVGRSSLRPFRGDVAVLVDGRSASASEIVASALQEIKGSPIVGRPTAGAVLMSTFERLPHGFRIQYPISDYVSIKGKRLEGNPLTPNFSLTIEELRSEEAAALALEALKNRS